MKVCKAGYELNNDETIPLRCHVKMNKDFNIIEESINNEVERILEENYRCINGKHSDIRIGYYGDENRFFSKAHNEDFILKPIKFEILLEDCTYNILEKTLIGVINETKYEYIIPPIFSINPKLCIYYYGCSLNGDSIEIDIRTGIIDSGE